MRVSPGDSVFPSLIREPARMLAMSIAAGFWLLPGCSGTIEDAPGDPGSGASTSSGGSDTGGTSGSGTGGSATGGVGTGGSAGSGTNGAAGTGTAGTGATGGVGGVAGSGGVDPNGITLGAIPANGTVGLEWPRVVDASGYRLYWSASAGVTPQNGQAIDVAATEATHVHRALTNGTPYYYVVAAITAAGEGPPSAEVTATPGGEWVLEELGAGDFDDIVTGARVPRIPVAKRIHVLLLPEGYQSGDLSIFHDHADHAGQRRNDVDRWVDEVFAKDPYSHFRSAFVVWYLPRASATHIGGGNTAFGVVMNGDSVGNTNAAAERLWAVLDDQGADAFPFPPTDFYSGGEARAINHVASFMIFDPDPRTMRAGFSGRATTLSSPAGQRINAGFARGHAHEFTHAFANVRDEYIETSSNGSGSEATNVADTNRCDEVPWSHLLEGRGINTTPGLVGAFGRAARGYHSEFRCHMNGTHINGEVWCSAGDERYPDDLTLRPSYFCNWCREIIAFRVFERAQVLPVESQSFVSTWEPMQRPKFFERFGFHVPEGPIPQTVSCNQGGPERPVFEDCVP